MGTSLVGNSNLVCKVYFPRLIIPAASAVTPVVDFLVAFAMLLPLMLWYGMLSTPRRVLTLPVLVLMASAAAFSAGLWLAALHVRYRDVAYIVPLFLQILMFLSPVAYSSTLVPARWRPFYDLNPLAGVIEGFRWALLRTPAPGAWHLAAGGGAVLVVLAGGIVFFRRTEETLVDII